MTVFADSLDDTAGTTLQAHTSGGRVWNRHSSFANNMLFSTTPGNTIRQGAGSATFMYYTSDVLLAEYDVECDLVVVALTAGHAAGAAGRISSGANTGYFGRYLVGTGLQLFRVSAGASTQLGSTVAGDLTPGQTYRLKLEIRNATKKLFLGGVEQISNADNVIAGPGFAGIRCSSGASTGDGTGVHINNWVVTDAASAPAPSGHKDSSGVGASGLWVPNSRETRIMEAA